MLPCPVCRGRSHPDSSLFIHQDLRHRDHRATGQHLPRGVLPCPVAQMCQLQPPWPWEAVSYTMLAAGLLGCSHEPQEQRKNTLTARSDPQSQSFYHMKKATGTAQGTQGSGAGEGPLYPRALPSWNMGHLPGWCHACPASPWAGLWTCGTRPASCPAQLCLLSGDIVLL